MDPFSFFREQARAALIEALDSRLGKKTLVIDPKVREGGSH
jgi:hypothetical protein